MVALLESLVLTIECPNERTNRFVRKFILGIYIGYTVIQFRLISNPQMGPEPRK
jgi:hypothetical protein